MILPPGASRHDGQPQGRHPSHGRPTPSHPSVLVRRYPARALTRARILLKADADGPDGWTDEEIADHLDTSRTTVQRVRRQFLRDGLDATLHRKRPTGRRFRKLDGTQEAKLVALACSAAPDGRRRWPLKLLAGRLVELTVVGAISDETGRRTLKETT